MGTLTCSSAADNMKAVVFLALLGVAAARPQFFLPGTTPVVTYKAAEGDEAKMIASPLTYTYPTTYGTFPYTYSTFPYTHPFGYPMVAPIVTNPTNVDSTNSSPRTKGSADAQPEPEADPFSVYTTFPFTGTTAYNFPTYPAVSTYSTFPYNTYPYATVGFPYTNVVRTV